jgi:ribonuclease R
VTRPRRSAGGRSGDKPRGSGRGGSGGRQGPPGDKQGGAPPLPRGEGPGRAGAPQATPARLLPYRVARWGKFWSLEPMFADVRNYLVAKGGPPPRLDDVVLAVPSHGDRRRIVERLGRSDDLKTVLRAMLYARDVRQGFGDDVREEAAALGGRGARPDHGRRDVTALTTFTIDPDTARDFDDALSVARDGAGYRVHVHIADVSYFVDDDGAIEAEARKRTSSLYLPLFAEPMLPPELSSGLCSLVPREPRKCVTTEFTFDAAGRRTSVQFYRSLISSDHRLTYGFVDEIIGDGGHAPVPGAVGAGDEAVAPDAPAGDGAAVGPAAAAALPPAAKRAHVPGATFAATPELVDQLRLAHELAGILRRRRMARGALALGSFEPEFALDQEGVVVGAVARPETPSHSLVEEYMLAANEAVAEFLLRKKGRTLYRVHEPPAAASARQLLDALEELHVPTPPFPGGLAVPAAELQQAYGRLSLAVAQTIAREGRGRLAFPNLLLRSLKQARYGPANVGHFGLASPAYLHFTSPIRRYPDLLAHRSLLFHLGEGGAELGEAELAAAGEDCSTRERDFSRLELDADDVALCFLLEDRLREEGYEQSFAGEVTGLVGGGLFVQFGGVFDGFLSARRLGGERFELSEHETALIGQITGRRIRLGDPVEVKVERVDKLRGKVDLTPALEAGGPAAGPAAGAYRGIARRGPGSRPPRRRPPGDLHGRRHR